MQVHRSITEILELCFSFSELIQSLDNYRYVLSAEKQDTFENISVVRIIPYCRNVHVGNNEVILYGELSITLIHCILCGCMKGATCSVFIIQ